MHTSSYSPAEIRPSTVGVVPCGAYSVRVGTAFFRLRFSRRRTRVRIALLGMAPTRSRGDFLRVARSIAGLHAAFVACRLARTAMLTRADTARPPHALRLRFGLWKRKVQLHVAIEWFKLVVRAQWHLVQAISRWRTVAHRGCRFNTPAWSSKSMGAHGGDTARKAASTGGVPAIRWMGRLENAVAGGGAAA